MKNVFISAVVAVSVLYPVDSLWFGGKYATAVNGMLTRIVHHFR